VDIINSVLLADRGNIQLLRRILVSSNSRQFHLVSKRLQLISNQPSTSFSVQWGGTLRWHISNDIIVYSKSLEEHIGHLAAVLEALSNAGMILAEGKCHFGYQDIKLLGYRISRLGLSTLEEKLQAILAIPYPETVKQAMVILGMFNYYGTFIDSFALVYEVFNIHPCVIERPLNQLISHFRLYTSSRPLNVNRAVWQDVETG